MYTLSVANARAAVATAFVKSSVHMSIPSLLQALSTMRHLKIPATNIVDTNGTYEGFKSCLLQSQTNAAVEMCWA